MKKIIIFVLIVFIITVVVTAFFYLTSRPIKQEGFEAEVLVSNLDTPWAIDFLPDGKMIFTERYGVISIFDEETRTMIAKLPVKEVSESGLLGIAVDPEFEKNNFIYVYYSYQKNDSMLNRVSRFVLKEGLLDEIALLDDIPGSSRHDGGRIKFGPEGKLYVTTGDAIIPLLAQNIKSLAGKILRMNKDGTIPEDNPFGNYVYSYGHRNPQGIAWHPITRQLFASEHGPTRNDELNVIVKGGNYGWPQECDEVSDKYINPIRCYSEFTLAPAGIAFYNNDLYVTGLRGAQLRKIIFADDGTTIVGEEEMFGDIGRIREVVEHNGYLYIATSNRDGRGIPKINDDKIIRVKNSLKI